MKDQLSQLKELTEKFHNNIKQYKSSVYDEANTRVDFIDKFFMLLDWDVSNNQGYSEQYREVVREDKIQIEGKQKAPDYSFRIGKERKFFVEAKKPSVAIKDEIVPAYQVRRYGYTAKLPLSILTDFEEFSVYDTRIKPDKNDKASVARVFYCTYEEYEKHFEFIYHTFSKNAILKGSFDQYTSEKKNKKGTSEVDKELLKLVEGWRTDLAKNIALRNPEIDIYNLNNAVQKIIDRIIFLRIAEDKEIEPYEQLLNLTDTSPTKGQAEMKKPSPTREHAPLLERLNEVFSKANKKYNAGLFQPEKLLSEIKIDDKILSSIIKGLYYPECPYEFSILPIEILGNIYEQFLGKTIKFRNVKDGHTAIIEEKPEVRKAGGVYYTPQYIVNYIVENTIGEKIKDKSPNEIEKIRICDPACGSGSFLVGAYQYLLNYHLDFYTNLVVKDQNVKNEKSKGKSSDSISNSEKEKWIKKWLKDGKIYQVKENEFKLTIEEKQKILINSIYGVDIDPQAVEVTKLSLYLKLLENEGKESEGSLFKHSDLKLLPTLDQNIKCGNSLIGSDFYKDKDLSLFGNDELRKVNVFDWDKEFPEVFQAGGFDVVIGNPPYVKYENLDDDLKKYSRGRYECSEGFFDLFQLFLEKSYITMRLHGNLGFIFPNLFLKGMNYKLSRKFFYENTSIRMIKNYGDGVFEHVQMPTCVFIVCKNTFKNKKVTFSERKKGHFEEFVSDQLNFNNDNYIFTYELICEKINKKFTKLENFIEITRGIEIGKDKSIINSIESIKILFGEDVQRYLIKKSSYISQETYEKFKKNEQIFKNEKIIIRETGIKIVTVYDDKQLLTNRSLYCIRSININLKYMLGILNSNLIQYYYENQFRSDTNVFPKIRIGQVKQIPIPNLDLANKNQKSQHDKLVSLVDQMLEAQKKLHNAKSESDKKTLKQKIDLIDQQIDALVYELYGLTEEEIKIVEGG